MNGHEGHLKSVEVTGCSFFQQTWDFCFFHVTFHYFVFQVGPPRLFCHQEFIMEGLKNLSKNIVGDDIEEGSGSMKRSWFNSGGDQNEANFTEHESLQ